MTRMMVDSVLLLKNTKLSTKQQIEEKPLEMVEPSLVAQHQSVAFNLAQIMCSVVVLKMTSAILITLKV